VIRVPERVSRTFALAGKSASPPLAVRAQTPAAWAVTGVLALIVVVAVAVCPLTLTLAVAE